MKLKKHGTHPEPGIRTVDEELLHAKTAADRFEEAQGCRHFAISNREHAALWHGSYCLHPKNPDPSQSGYYRNCWLVHTGRCMFALPGELRPGYRIPVVRSARDSGEPRWNPWDTVCVGESRTICRVIAVSGHGDDYTYHTGTARHVAEIPESDIDDLRDDEWVVWTGKESVRLYELQDGAVVCVGEEGYPRIISTVLTIRDLLLHNHIPVMWHMQAKRLYGEGVSRWPGLHGH